MRASYAELAGWRAETEEAGLTLSAWVRRTLRHEVEREAALRRLEEAENR